ncbi:MAG: 1,6-dihydroxycyclohexa-2,4-diene-1-carboxylate dehydrogenase [Burkholderiaceae bacterium]|nr:1,6-dihydroxycyclohexa-2,4-diene-1-carboxylate dehydrogenase [Burkholderiaceae bacterium]
MISPDRFKDKIAIVTGAAQGVGKATAMRMAAEGASVVLVDRAVEPCQAVLAQITQAGGRAICVNADLQTHAGAVQMVQQALAFGGRIDVSVHNVGGTIWFKPFWEYQPEEIEQEVSRSLWPALWCCREVIPVMRKQGRGAIVNVGSPVTRGGVYRVPYAASKGGVHAMTVCMANELGDSGVRVNCVAPGALDNADRVVPRNPNPLSEAEKGWVKEMYGRTVAEIPLHRLGRAEEVAAAICFVAADEASYMTGQVISAAGGLTA